jgi:hypothetical protein
MLIGNIRIGGLSVSGGFRPTSISGLQLWLDATTGLFDATSGGNPVTADGSSVARWEDQSGSGYHATQATLANRPLLKTAIRNSKNVIRFDGSNDILVSANIPDNNLLTLTAFVVANPIGLGGNNAGRMFERGTNIVNLFMYFGTGISMIGGGGQVIGGSAPIGSFYLFGARLSGVGNGTTSLRINKSVVVVGDTVSAPSTANTTYQIGNRTDTARGFNGDIAELIIYNQALTTQQIDSVEAYLSDKWGF